MARSPTSRHGRGSVGRAGRGGVARGGLERVKRDNGNLWGRRRRSRFSELRRRRRAREQREPPGHAPVVPRAINRRSRIHLSAIRHGGDGREVLG